MKEISVIITAGGIGKRMGTEVPKQFLLLCGRPILMRTLEQLQTYLPDANFIITLPEEWRLEWKRLCLEYSCTIDHEVVSGGKERFDSVKNALAHCSGSYVFIHDGVRPLVSNETVQRAVVSVQKNVACVPSVDIFESLRYVDKNGNKAVNRNEYKLIQTPQCFHKEELVKAYAVNFSAEFTDDASVMENSGYEISLFEGNTENLKITQLSDLTLAEMLWEKR
jgi:2-C-methyl-D-erythritol 4-phosphate cytidylyltransferase